MNEPEHDSNSILKNLGDLTLVTIVNCIPTGKCNVLR